MILTEEDRNTLTKTFVYHKFLMELPGIEPGSRRSVPWWHSATNRKVAGSIPASVIGFFIDIKSF